MENVLLLLSLYERVFLLLQVLLWMNGAALSWVRGQTILLSYYWYFWKVPEAASNG